MVEDTFRTWKSKIIKGVFDDTLYFGIVGKRDTTTQSPYKAVNEVHSENFASNLLYIQFHCGF